MKLRATIIQSRLASVAICGRARSHPRESNALTDSLITKSKVGIMRGNPNTGNREEFFPALAEMAEIRVNPAASPKQANSIATANKPTS